MSKKGTETKKGISIKHLQNISFIMLKTVCHHQKVFWIRLPLSAWKQDYLPHSDKIKNIKKLRKNAIKPMKNTGFKSNSPAMGCG